MKRIALFLVVFVVVLYGSWPYYTIYRLDSALGAEDVQAIAPFVDLSTIRAGYREQAGAALKDMMPDSSRGGESEPLVEWLAESLRPLGEAALERTVTLDWVRHVLRDAAQRATDERPVYFIAGIDHAFFQSWNRFGIRLGSTEVVMQLQGLNWRVTALEERAQDR